LFGRCVSADAAAVLAALLLLGFRSTLAAALAALLLVTSPFERSFGIARPQFFAPIFIDGRRE
jgi:hypothetical protein